MVRPPKKSAANWALTKAPSQGIGRELEAFGHGQECQARTRHEVRVPCPDWKREPTARMLSPDLNEVRVRPHKRSGAELGTHKRSCPDWKHEPAARMLSPGLSEARVQHPTSVGSVSANPNEVRVHRFATATRSGKKQPDNKFRSRS